jgi:hypothetical protein
MGVMPKISSPDILALDMSTKTGWAHSSGKSGVLNLPKVRVDGHNGYRYIKFHEWLRKTTAELPTKLIVFEHGTHKAGGPAMLIGIGMRAALELFCAQANIQPEPLHTMTIKKHAVGSAAFKGKEPMKFAARKARGATIELIDDNHIDALWILDLALSRFAKLPSAELFRHYKLIWQGGG